MGISLIKACIFLSPVDDHFAKALGSETWKMIKKDWCFVIFSFFVHNKERERFIVLPRVVVSGLAKVEFFQCTLGLSFGFCLSFVTLHELLNSLPSRVSLKMTTIATTTPTTTPLISTLTLSSSEDEDKPVATTTETGEKKKKKRNRNKKKVANPPVAPSTLTQTTPTPTIPIDTLYPTKNFPEGQLIDYAPQRKNFILENLAEKKAMEKLVEENYQDLRRAAEAHRQTRSVNKIYLNYTLD